MCHLDSTHLAPDDPLGHLHPGASYMGHGGPAHYHHHRAALVTLDVPRGPTQHCPSLGHAHPAPLHPQSARKMSVRKGNLVILTEYNVQEYNVQES